MPNSSISSGVTPLQIAALRKSDRIVFRHDKGASQIEAIKEHKPTAEDPYARDQSVVIPCLFACHDYGGHGTETYPAPPRAIEHKDAQSGRFFGFYMNHSGGRDAELKTLLTLVKAGDVLTIHWERNAGTNPAIYALGVECDQVKLSLDRPSVNKSMIFLIDAHAFRSGSENSRFVRSTRFG